MFSDLYGSLEGCSTHADVLILWSTVPNMLKCKQPITTKGLHNWENKLTLLHQEQFSFAYAMLVLNHETVLQQ